MIFGTLGAIASGIGQPMFSLFFGNLLDFINPLLPKDEYFK
jgi:hypothetical protein